MLIKAQTPTIPAIPASFLGKLMRLNDLINLFCCCEFIFALLRIAAT